MRSGTLRMAPISTNEKPQKNVKSTISSRTSSTSALKSSSAAATSACSTEFIDPETAGSTLRRTAAQTTVRARVSYSDSLVKIVDSYWHDYDVVLSRFFTDHSLFYLSTRIQPESVQTSVITPL